MAEVRIVDGRLRVRFGRWERVFAVRGDLDVPVTAIHSVRAVDNAYAEVRGMLAPGTGFPGRIALGTWRGRGRRDVVAIYGSRPAGVVIELEPGHRVDRVIVSTPNAESLAEEIRAATPR